MKRRLLLLSRKNSATGAKASSKTAVTVMAVSTRQKLLTMVIVLLMYAWGFEWLGFPIATAILTVVIGMLFGATIPAAGISGAVLGILLWYAFDRLLDVTLPLGAWLG